MGVSLRVTVGYSGGKPEILKLTSLLPFPLLKSHHAHSASASRPSTLTRELWLIQVNNWQNSGCRLVMAIFKLQFYASVLVAGTLALPSPAA